MNENEIREIAEEISFRLLATRNHIDMEWLVDKLKTINNKKPIPPCRGHDFWDEPLDMGDVNEY